MSVYGTYAERRVFPRYSLHLTGETEALFRRAPDFFSEASKVIKDHRYQVDIVNLSMGGAMITFEADFDEGDTLRMHIAHPVTGKKLVVEGHLAWVRKNATKLMGKYCAGLSFRNTTDTALAELIEYAATQGPPNADLK